MTLPAGFAMSTNTHQPGRCVLVLIAKRADGDLRAGAV